MDYTETPYSSVDTLEILQDILHVLGTKHTLRMWALTSHNEMKVMPGGKLENSKYVEINILLNL